ncbi:hypothetical protein AZA_31767 [Nitrospirillum viridazoti Y2]|nr:hypothetical protein AZA_31767 [Nitrospirillum amazonense Y2]
MPPHDRGSLSLEWRPMTRDRSTISLPCIAMPKTRCIASTSGRFKALATPSTVSNPAVRASITRSSAAASV